MKFLEKDLEDIIWEAQKTKNGRKDLDERGLFIGGKIFRQFNLFEYGICDLLEVIKYPGKHLLINIYELKNKEINAKSLIQACRYKKGIAEYCKIHFPKYYISYGFKLIGSSIDLASDFVHLYNIIENCEIYTYSYSLNGIKFTYQAKDWSIRSTPLLANSKKPNLKINDLRDILS